MNNFRRILLENRLRMTATARANSPTALAQRRHGRSAFNFDGTRSLPAHLCSPLIGDGTQPWYDPLASANEKLKRLSISYDSYCMGAAQLVGFQGPKLTKADFNIQLRRCLNVHFVPAEVDALFESLCARTRPQQGSDPGAAPQPAPALLDGVEFIRHFFHLGNEGRTEQLRQAREKECRMTRHVSRAKARQEEQLKALENSHIGSFTPEDAASAWKKLELISLRYSPQKEVDAAMLQRMAVFLSPYEFRVLLIHFSKTFTHTFTSPECAALIAKYDTAGQANAKDAERTVDGQIFVTDFIHLSRNAWEEHKKQQTPLRRRRERMNAMGQDPDILPPILGR